MGGCSRVAENPLCYGMAGSAVVGRCVVQVNRDPVASTVICLPSSYRLLICVGGQLDMSLCKCRMGHLVISRK